jgi:hypothetical protein
MRKLLVASLVAVLGAGTGVGVSVATAASAAPHASSGFTCSHFSDPTVEFVWSHVCRF